MTTPSINITRFVTNHHQQPKSRGEGQWAFTFVLADGGKVQEFTPLLSWPDAKKWAREKSKDLDAEAIHLDP